MGPEKITSDIPGVGDEKRRNLDESGVVRVGAYVRPGDILVGKITPEGERQLTGEERLVRNVFGEKADERKDSSMKAKPVVKVWLFTPMCSIVILSKKMNGQRRLRRQKKKNSKRFEPEELRVLRQSAKRKLVHTLDGEKVKATYRNAADEEIVRKGQELTVEMLSKLELDEFETLEYSNGDIYPDIWDIVDTVVEKSGAFERSHEEKIERLSKGDDLPPGDYQKGYRICSHQAKAAGW